MPTRTKEAANDVWSDWLLNRRHGGDPGLAQIVQIEVDQYADRVIAGARLGPGMILVDVGTGEGLVALRAIKQVGPSLKVILTDVSKPMLRHTAYVAEQRGVGGQCSFIECPADDLSSIPDGSVDAVTTRSVLAYVDDKGLAIREFLRILNPGGRMSIGEPVLQDDALFVRVLKMRLDSRQPIAADRFLRLLHRWKSAQFPDTEEASSKNSLVNYNERTLFKQVLDAGFVNGHMELHIDVRSSMMTSWDTFINCSPHPWAPSLTQVLDEQFTVDERKHFEEIVRPTVESGTNTSTERMVFITAQKPVER